MRLHEITNRPGDYLLTDSQAEGVIGELLRSVGNIRPSAVGCSRRQPAMLRDRTPRCPTCCPTSARPAARPEASHSLALPDLPDLLSDRETSSSSCEGRRWGAASRRVLCFLPQKQVGQVGRSGS
jgi:hypothetical protein